MIISADKFYQMHDARITQATIADLQQSQAADWVVLYKIEIHLQIMKMDA